MKCPVCGYWNKDTFPHCFKCGEPLHPDDKPRPEWQEIFDRPQPRKRRVVYDDTTAPVEDVVEDELTRKEQESLAAEMTRLKDRRARGTVLLGELRQSAAGKGIAPTGKGVSVRRGGFQVPDNPDETVQPAVDDYDLPPIEPEKPVKVRRTKDRTPIAPPALENPYAAYDIDMPPAFDTPGPIAPHAPKRRRRRVRGPMLLVYVVVGVLALSLLAFIVYVGVSYLIPSLFTDTGGLEAVESYTIEPIEVDGQPGHRIQIAGEEGTQIYIVELMRSYVVVGGLATIDAADHVFYDTIENLNMPSMEVTLTPTLLRGNTETRMEQISYMIDIPASPLRIVTPEGGAISVNASVYSIQIEVAPGSTVIIGGEDVSDTISEKGIVFKNYSVKPTGYNHVAITVRAPYCRESRDEVVIYREPIEIPLELDAASQMTTNKENFAIYATTDPMATITVESPYFSIDDSMLAETGAFSVATKMTRVGNNTIVLRASMEGKADSVVEHTIYYLPPAAVYTPKAWLLDRAGYNELLGNMSVRIKNAQIYKCTGTITSFISDNPQIAIMDTSSDGKEQLVLLENGSNKQWTLGEKYDVYADVSGVYNTMPRMIGRYTYPH